MRVSMKVFLEENDVMDFMEYGSKLDGMMFKTSKEFVDVMVKLEKMLEHYGFERVKKDSLKANDSTYNFFWFVFVGNVEKDRYLKVEVGMERISARKYQGFFRYNWLYQ